TADIKYLAEWINTFVSRMNRWASPKYLIGWIATAQFYWVINNQQGQPQS
ncbi:MAG: hypothetical protein RL733_1143, partial [Actinomycetota bacterium]